MFDLPYDTHRYFVQPVSNQPHVRNLLLQRFFGFLSQIEKSPKLLPKALLKVVRNDVRSTTGSNLRNILLLTDKSNVDDLKINDVKTLIYSPVKNENLWKIDIVRELIDVKAGQKHVEDFSEEELQNILEYICSN